MKEHALILREHAVRSVLAGTKTQHRIAAPIARFEIRDHDDGMVSWSVGFSKPMGKGRVNGSYSGGRFTHDQARAIVGSMFCPLGAIGDRLWIREPWAYGIHALAAQRDEDGPFVYAASHSAQERLDHRWRPSITMPRFASRIELEIASVRLERLHDISEADAGAEGVRSNANTTAETGHKDNRSAYAALWEHEHGAGSWDATPWVWALAFRQI